MADFGPDEDGLRPDELVDSDRMRHLICTLVEMKTKKIGPRSDFVRPIGYSARF
jgi:hypothetical protein